MASFSNMFWSMTKSNGTARTLAPRSKLTGINPRNFSRTAWWRFARDRRQRYVSRTASPPSDAQAALIESMISLEWAALQAEAEGGLRALRESREHRRLLERFRSDFERSIALPVPKAKPPSLAEIIADHRGAE